MMDGNSDRLQSIATKTDLVPTAKEFIPKSQSNTEYVYEYQSTSNYNAFESPSFNSSSGEGSSRNIDFNIPSSSRQEYNQNSGGIPRRNDTVFFNNNKDSKYYKYNPNKPHNRWRGDNRNRMFQPTGHPQDFEIEEEYPNKFYNKPRQKPRFNNSNYTNNYVKNKGYNRNGNQYKSQPDSDNLSWRKRDNLGESEPNQGYYNKDRQRFNENVAHNDNTSHKKINSFKQGNNYKFKENLKADPVKIEEKTENDIPSKTSQREHLIKLLTQGVLECLVCCESIHQNSSVWSCSNCYHVLHLKCIIKWAKSSKSDFGWRCPACQNVTASVPYEYFCFCGKIKNPEWNHQDCPHSCGETCGKTPRKSCPHKCTLLCHPGPCPQCTAFITKSCGCGRTTRKVQCCSTDVVECDNECGKELNCLIHVCHRKCHVDACEECKEVVSQDCFCGKEHREVKCTIEAIGVNNFSCGNVCEKKLGCGKHVCLFECHEGNCPQCEVTPELVKFCPCGKTELSSLKEGHRESCSDPIPTCDLVCGKTLSCSQPGNPHACQSKCHNGSCPVCPLESTVRCRCGHMDKTVPCSELSTRAGDIRCDKKCSKKRSCGKHKCNQLCCTGSDHECPLACNRLLQCGLHRCEDTCHTGHCKPCLRASFEELSCECGAEVIFPPVPCGTRRPPCERPCTRNHACEHPPTHNCHSENQCPPCTVLTKKYCHGRHELRRAVPCHQESFSCGLPCGKELECGKHKCVLPCHSGPCLKENQSCVQLCNVSRPVCGHICGSPCHDGTCPTETPCKEMVRVTCECGHRYTTRACHDNAKEYQRIATAKLATKMADLQAGQTIDLDDLVSASKKLSYKTLECNDECKLIERNRRLAIALQIRNPDLSAKLTPRYSDYLKNWTKKDPRFCQFVHDKLTDLVQLAKESKQKSRSYSFDPMNREKRHFIHEYCKHFGCESMAYDQEPKRNVVATAFKDKSWLPSMSLTEFAQKENSPRKVPAPVTAKNMPSATTRTMEVLPSKILPHHQSDSAEGSSSSNSNTNTEPQIDYFNWRPQNN